MAQAGTLVQYLQSLLKTLGFYSRKIDGIFGNQTKTAVLIFQRDFGISQDGIVGPNTWNKLSNFFYIVPTDIQYGSNILEINLDGFSKKFPFLEIGTTVYSVLRNPINYIRFGKGSKAVFYQASIHAKQ